MWLLLVCIYHEATHMADVDSVLLQLAEELRAEEVHGTFQARVWVKTGLNSAAQIVERKRIELMLEGFLSNNESP